ncbi:MAG: ATP-binding protein [bacterium]|nr:ATP-binding protein [bacterium]
MKAATEESQETWYPMELAYDQRHEVEARRLLFPDLQSGMAHRDLPLSSFLPAIDRQLDKSTRSMFLNMYGLSGRSRTDTQTRWNGLVSLADALNSWRRNLPTAGADQETARNLFKGLRILLDLRLSGWSGDVPGKIALDRLPGEEGPLLPWAYAEVRDPVEVLRKQVLLIVIGDGTAAAESAPVLRAWARERFSDLHRDQRKDLDETDFGQALERSVVIAVVLEGIPALKSALPPGHGGPHFILLDMLDLTEIVIQPNPAQKLLTRAFEDIGRRSFTPYKLAGSLPGGSDLFVGRENEVQTILGSLDREDHAILGSRRIGKTSLLQAVEYRLRERDRQVPALFLRLKDHSDVKDFYSQLKWALGGIGHGKLADRLSDHPGTEHADLYEVMHTLAEKFGHPVVVLMDEVDGLYLWDLHQNQERLFQFLRNNLAQSTPRLCTFVMTGFRHIYLNRLNSGSVFFNFCRFQNLLGVERESVGHLVRMLKGFNIKIEEEAEVIGLVEHGTYAIPYYVQRACDNLLRRVDRLGQNSIGPADAQAVLDQDIRALLKRELWDDLNVDPLLDLTGPEGSSEDRRNQLLKVKSLLLATIITHYEYKSRPETAQVTPAGGQPTFTAKEAIDYLNELCPDAWPATERAVDRLLRALTMTLALAPAAEDRWAYLFPNDILPDVLYFYERQGTMNLIDELDGIVRALKELPSA